MKILAVVLQITRRDDFTVKVVPTVISCLGGGLK